MDYARARQAAEAAGFLQNEPRHATARFSLQLRVHKDAEIEAVTYDGRELSCGEADGFVVWDDTASHIVRVNVNTHLTAGEHTAAVRYHVHW